MTTTTIRAAARAAVVVASSLALWGCPPCGGVGASIAPPGGYTQFSALGGWEFEEECASRGPVCGFRVESGSASRSALFHPGEHGLTLGRNSSVSHALTDPTPSTTTGGLLRGSPSVRLLYRCDAGTSLVVSLRSVSREAALSMSGGAPRTSPAMLSAMPLSSEYWLSTSVYVEGAPVDDVIVGVHIATSGAGGCQVDNLFVERGAMSGFCE